MKHILLFALLSLGSVLHSQKHDYQWILGYGGGNTLLDFRNIPLTTQFSHYRFEIWRMSATVSDSLGNLIFYSNANDVWDRNRAKMPNGDSLSVEFFYDGSPFDQSMVVLAQHENSNIYHFMQLYPNLNTSVFDAPIHNRLNMGLRNGLGDIELKYKYPFVDSFAMWVLATRHANGRDWWAIYSSIQSERHYVYLVNEQGPSLHHIDTVNIPWPRDPYYLGWSSAMSPMGDRLVIQDWRQGQGMMELGFDRCDGHLSYQSAIRTLVDGGSCGFSTNGELAYYNTGFHMIQLDLTQPDYWLYPDTVAVYDSTFNVPWPANFNRMQVAPDGRLFVSGTGSQHYIHIIERPNIRGKGCTMKQFALPIHPTYNFSSLPYYPNYRLGALDGSPCDTLGLDAPPLLTWAQQVQTVTEGYTQVALRMRLDRPSTDTIRTSVRYVPSYGSTTVGQDLDAFPDVPVTLLPGDTSATVYVQLLDDNLPERPDTAVFAIVHPTHAVAPSWYCYLDILDNDPSGTASTPWAEDILLYPNPAMDYLTIDARGSNIEGGRYTLIDALGRILRTGDLLSQKQWLDLRDLPSGLYFLELRNEGALLSEGSEGVKRMKVLKQ